MSYVKVHASIIASTVWRLPLPTKVMWITMLAMADRDGIVRGSVPGLAVLAGVTTEEAEIAIESFLSPDKYSRTQEDEGRRIEVVRGGWRLLNYEAYRELLSEDDRKRNAAERMVRYRERMKRQNVSSDAPVTACSSIVPKVTVADREHKKQRQNVTKLLCPKFTKTIRGEFPSCSENQIDRIVSGAIKEFPSINDDELVCAFLEASETEEHYSPATYARTVPAVIRAWKS